MNLPIVLLAVIFSLETVGACTTAPFILAIEELFYGGREVYCHMPFEVVSAGADMAAVGVQTVILGRRGWGTSTVRNISGYMGCRVWLEV